MNESQNPGTTATYLIFCIILIAATTLQIYLITSTLYCNGDYSAYAAGIDAISAGLNPYLHRDILQFLPVWMKSSGALFDYPPHTAYLFQALDRFSIFHNIGLYHALLALSVLAAMIVMLHTGKNHNPLFLLTLTTSGFMGIAWDAYAGNFHIVFLLALAIFVHLIKTEHETTAAIVLGISASLTVFLLPFVAVFVFTNRTVLERIRLITLSSLIILELFIIDYIFNPSLLVSYLSMLHASNGPFTSSGGMDANNIYGILQSVVPDSFLTFAILSVIAISVGLLAIVLHLQRYLDNPIKTISFTILTIGLLLPRIMPYDFIIFVLPVYFLFRDKSELIKIIALTICAFPLFVWYYPNGINILPYSQIYSLIAVYLLYVAIIFQYSFIYSIRNTIHG